MPNPRVFIVSGPSGVGKSSIIQGVLRQREDLQLSVSTTTREIREGEQEGRDYYFVDQSAFERMIAESGFLEWARNYDNYYGTGREQIENILSQGVHALLDIDTQGALNIQSGFGGAVYIFIKPPSLKDLEVRLRGRGSETPATLEKRLARAEAEIGKSGLYDHIIINDTVEEAIAEFMAIVEQESKIPVPFQKLGGGAVSPASAASLSEAIMATLENSVRTALRPELEGLIHERIQRVLQEDLERILMETYQELKES